MIGIIYIVTLILSFFTIFTKEGYYQRRAFKLPLRFLFLRGIRTRLERIKAYRHKQKWSALRFSAQVRMMENPELFYCLVYGIALLVLLLIIYFFNPFYGFFISPVILAPVVRKEILNTGIVCVEDFAEISGNHTHTEIQNALDYAKAEGKPCVYIGPGTWTCTAQITMTPIDASTDWEGVTVMGAGPRETLLDFGSGTTITTAFSIEVYDQGGGSEDTGISVIYLTMKDLGMDCDRATTDILRFNYSHNSYMERVIVGNSTQSNVEAILVEDCDMGTWNNVYVEGMTNGVGFYFHDSTDFTLTSCQAQSDNDIGVKLDDDIINFDFVGGRYMSAFEFQECNYGNTLSGCFFIGDGILMDSTIAEGGDDKNHHNVIENCYFNGNSSADHAVDIIQGSYNTIKYCYSYAHDVSTINVGEGSGGTSIGNRIIDVYWDGWTKGAHTADASFLIVAATGRETYVEMDVVPWNDIADSRGDTIYNERSAYILHPERRVIYVIDGLSPFEMTDYTLTNSGVGGETNWAVGTATAGGVLIGQTGATSGNWVQAFLNYRSFGLAQFPLYECRLKVNDVSEAEVYFGLYKDSNEFVRFFLDNGTVKYQHNNGGTTTTVTTGSTVSDNIWYVFQFRMFDDTTDSIDFYLDGVSLGSATSNVPTAPMGPYMRAQTTSNTNIAVRIDYKKVVQRRAT